MIEVPHIKTFDIHLSFRPLHLSIRRGFLFEPEHPTIKDLQEKQRNFRRLRPKFDLKDSGDHLTSRLVEEAEELRKELPPPGRQATQQERDKIAGELSDCLSFIFNIANHYGIDAAIAFYTKMAEVEKRYPAHLFQVDGKTFDESYQQARKMNGH